MTPRCAHKALNVVILKSPPSPAHQLLLVALQPSHAMEMAVPPGHMAVFHLWLRMAELLKLL